MFLSRIQLNPHRRDAWRLLSSPQRMHAAVLQSFLDPPTGDLEGRPRVLWRLDTEPHKVFLYVVSPTQPDLTHIAEQAGWPELDRGASKPYQPFLDHLASGQRWAFRLTANPTRYRRPKDGGPAKRVGHVTVGYQREWLLEKAAASGFTVEQFSMPGIDDASPIEGKNVSVTGRRVQHFDRSEQKVTLSTAQFDGELTVADADLLRGALVSGIGPAKAYGCGLLTLAPVLSP